jgi:D,D-heptose 1,7-bisphosphate phosphatase
VGIGETLIALSHMQIVILAGGKGTRLGPLTERMPKPMVPIAGKPILAHQLEVTQRYGLTRVLILTGYLGDQIAAYFADGSSLGLQISYCREAAPLGTAGALNAAKRLLDREFLVIYGDIIFDLDLNRLIRFHHSHQSSATLVVHPNDHPEDSDLVDIDAHGRIRSLVSKDRPSHEPHRNLVNAGIFCLNRSLLENVPTGTSLDFGGDVVPSALKAGLALYAYNTPEYVKDVGTPSRHAKVEADILSGMVRRRNFAHARPAAFLDRDGVLTRDRDHVRAAEELDLMPGVAAALTRLNRSEYLSVVVTNQPGIAKGFLSDADLERLHTKLETALGDEGAWIDRIYYCPHHPERGFPGERSELKVICDCRKPQPGMLLRAAEELNIDLSASFMIGDRMVDVEAGERAGAATIMVGRGEPQHQPQLAKPDFRCDDLVAAVTLIMESRWLISPARELAEELVRNPAKRATSVVAIGGLAHCGKTTLATLLAWQLRRFGMQSVQLRLDDYLLPSEQRSGLPSVRQRYDYSAINRAVATAMDKRKVTIIDGVVSLDIPGIRNLATHKLFLKCDEAVRRNRFLATYLGRGKSIESAQELYEGRDREEREVVAASSVWADRVLIKEVEQRPMVDPPLVREER